MVYIILTIFNIVLRNKPKHNIKEYYNTCRGQNYAIFMATKIENNEKLTKIFLDDRLAK